MTLALDILSWICLVGGAVFCVIGGIGILRLPNVYARTHASGICDTLGATLILLGLMFQAGPNLVAVKLLMVIVFTFLIGPMVGHALMKAAYAGGVRCDVPGRRR